MTDGPRKMVRVTGERNGMIAFDYGLDDLAYAIELMMPADVFEAFCREHGVARCDDQRPEPDNQAAEGMALRPSQVALRL